ncbi:MAG: hypothetical protein IKE60_26490 [Reyranella sp.]|uniref:hypothetical protein n=1 Tax=Reyranella sp. TaxID=1929291 RepID=UPI0025EE27A7|nr:hypothetical protein [Reyranella sp.]MBR2818239.1 hypothetical protein [Reyranella sp.]
MTYELVSGEMNSEMDAKIRDLQTRIAALEEMYLSKIEKCEPESDPNLRDAVQLYSISTKMVDALQKYAEVNGHRTGVAFNIVIDAGVNALGLKKTKVNASASDPSEGVVTTSYTRIKQSTYEHLKIFAVINNIPMRTAFNALTEAGLNALASGKVSSRHSFSSLGEEVRTLGT